MAFADIGDVEDRIDFDLDERQTRMVSARLDDASDLATQLAGISWTDANVPRVVRAIVLNSVVRWINNPDAITTSRAGDETLAWSDLGEKGSFYFSEQELEALKGFTRTRAPFGSISVTTWGTREPLDDTIWVPTSSGTPYPYLSIRDGVLR